MSISDPLTFRRGAGRLLNALLRAFNVRLINSIPPERHSDLWHSTIVLSATYSPWLADPAFGELYERISGHTLVDVYRCYELWQIARQLDGVAGDFLEVGVWRGGTGAILAKAAEGTPRTVYLADTFAGVVKASDNDPSYAGGEHADASESDVRGLMRDLSLRNVEILRGVFPEQTESRVPGQIALLHCDVDVYQSAKDVIEWALPRIAVNGVVIFDDYGFRGTEGVTRCVNELQPREDFLFLYNLNGHAILVRRRMPSAGTVSSLVPPPARVDR